MNPLQFLSQFVRQLLTVDLNAKAEPIKTGRNGQAARQPPQKNDNPPSNQDTNKKEPPARTTPPANRPAVEFEALREKLNELLSDNYEGIVIHNKINILDANDSLASMFGYTLHEIRSMTVLDLSAPESRSTVLQNTLTKYEYPYKAIGLRRDKSTFSIEIFSTGLAHNGALTRVMAIREISDRDPTEIINEIQNTKKDLETRFKESTTELRFANERLHAELQERKRIEAEIMQRNRELTILQSAGTAITSSLDLRYVLNTVTLEMAKLLDVESCAISTYNIAANTITTMARYDLNGWHNPESMTNTRHLADYPVTREVLEEQIPEQLTISQANIDPAEAAYMHQTNIKTRMMLPMVYQRQVVGLAELEDSRLERTFTSQELSLAKLLASQAASAIENARLYEQAQQEIMERKQAEAALEQERALLAQRVEERTAELSRANAELARASRLKDEFLAGMSHELRTPLNAILGSAEILQAEVFGPLTERQQKFAKNVEESGRHLLSLINDILDLSKIEAGKMGLNIRPVSVKSICETSLQMIRQLAHKKQLKVSQSFDDTVTVLLADELRLKQILVNLLSNAVKFTPDGGQIGLDVVGDAAQQVVHFTVWDTGIGIAPDDLTHLFQPFVQLDSSLTRQYAGTGLGLSLVARMTEMHGGGVSVETEVGQGSRFTVSFPWREARPATKEGDHEEDEIVPRLRTSSRKPLILLADDNEDNITTLEDYLTAKQYRVIVARHGQEAIERTRESKPDLILMDVQMPGMDGLEATRHLRRDVSTSHIPIIMVTALAMSGDRERCLAAGANEYLSKPVSLSGLIQAIETQLKRTMI